MTNAAMRYGVQFVEPGEPQMRPGSRVASVCVAPLDWEARGLGKTVGRNEGAEPRAAANFGNLLRSEAQSVQQVIGKVVASHSFNWRAKGFTKDGKPVSFAEGSSDIVELVNRGEANAKAKGLTPYNPLAKAGGVESTKAAPPYGRASIARAVLVQSLARMDGGAGRRAILDAARQLVSPGPVVAQADGADPATTPATPASNVPKDLRRLWSQGERPVDALTSKDRALTVLRAAWGAAFTRMYGDGRIKVVSQAEAVELLGGVAYRNFKRPFLCRVRLRSHKVRPG